jgi:hypothetical protein
MGKENRKFVTKQKQIKNEKEEKEKNNILSLLLFSVDSYEISEYEVLIFSQ